MRWYVLSALFLLSIYVLAAAAQEQVIRCANGEGPYHGAFERNYCAVQYCGKDPESWTRGSADIDTATGRFGITIELETDSAAAGPKGSVVAHLKDTSGADIGSATLGAALGGKRPGHSRIEDTSKVVMIPVATAQKVKLVTIEAHCTGKQGGLLGTPISVVGFSHTFPLP